MIKAIKEQTGLLVAPSTQRRIAVKLQQCMLLIPANEVMDAFCYSYAAALLRKLKSLYEDGLSGSAIGDSVSSALCQQVSFPTPSRPPDVEALIELAEEFLAIFEVR